MKTDEAKRYLISFCDKHFKDKTYHHYIDNILSGDFAWNLAEAMEKREVVGRVCGDCKHRDDRKRCMNSDKLHEEGTVEKPDDDYFVYPYY